MLTPYLPIRSEINTSILGRSCSSNSPFFSTYIFRTSTVPALRKPASADLYFANASIRPSRLELPDTYIDISSMVKESAVCHTIFSKSLLFSVVSSRTYSEKLLD